MVTAAARRTVDAMTAMADGAKPFRATVTAISGGLVTIKRLGATTADTETYARCASADVRVNDEVLCVMLGTQPVIVDAINRTAGGTTTFTKFAASGSTGSLTGSTGNDEAGLIRLVPGGSGVTSGDLLYVTFGVTKPSAHYAVHLQPFSSAASALGANVRPVSRSSVSFVVTTDTAPTSGSVYQWLYSVSRNYA